MYVSVITPTADRPVALELARKMMERQTRQPDKWVIADGSGRDEPPAENFTRNLLDGLRRATGDVFMFWEDDDWYGPEHIADCVARIEAGAHIVGSIQQRYYNVATRQWRTYRNRGACLAQTAIRALLLPLVWVAIDEQDSTYGVDAKLWELAREIGLPEDNFEEPGHVVGIKGLPGKAGLGVGHRPGAGWTDDPDMRVLREWVGEDANNYADFCTTAHD